MTLSFASCERFLDVQPVGKLIPTEVNQYENLLNNTLTLGYFFMYDNNYGSSYSFLGDNLQISENQLLYKYEATFPNLDILQAWIFQGPIYDPKASPMGWSYTWQGIAYFNNVIDGVTKLDPDSEYSKEVIAQAKMGRAWSYMNYVLCYGPMYDPSGANDNGVLPLRVSGDPTKENGPLATTAEIFAQVKEDLDYACNCAPATTASPARGTKAAAYALRAEYHMYLRDWENMRKDATQAWELAIAEKGGADKLIYDYSDENFKYVQVGSVGTGDEDPRYYMEFRGPDTHYNQATNIEMLFYRYAPSGNNYTKFYPSEDWQSLFDKENDWRWLQWAMNIESFSIVVGTEKHSDGIQLNYLKDKYMTTTQGITYPILLLEKAEAELRCGQKAQALASLNLLRKYRYKGGNTDLANGTSLSEDQLLNEILNERRREQPLVGFGRTLDLKRYVFDSGKPWSKTTIEHRSGSHVYSAKVTDPIFQSLNIDNVIIGFNPQWGLQPYTGEYAPYNNI